MRAAKIDANQPAVVKAFRDAGASVTLLHRVGEGCPDAVVGWRGVNLLVEIKDGDKPPSAQKLTPAQQDWHRDWRGQCCVVNSPQAALVLLGVIPIVGTINEGEKP